MTTQPKTHTCPKCDGVGIIDAFAHIDNGRCFECGGAGAVEYRARKSECTAPTTKGDPNFRHLFTADVDGFRVVAQVFGTMIKVELTDDPSYTDFDVTACVVYFDRAAWKRRELVKVEHTHGWDMSPGAFDGVLDTIAERLAAC